jgi:hypothetical protein
MQNDNVYATIYAPGHAVSLNGTGDFMGSIVARSFNSSGGLKLHYDESLSYSTGMVIDYEVASWIEDVR